MAAKRTGLVVAALALATLATLLVYRPALDGPFLSDDHALVVANPWIRPLTTETLRELLDPFGAPARATANWAPLHMLAHALGLHWFGASVRGHHLVNVALHVANAALLLALLRRSGVRLAAAGFGALLFLLHPAHVEAVAWISQLKSVLGMAFGLCALLAAPRAPFVGLIAFALAVLAKPMAIAFLGFEAARVAMQLRRGERAGLPWALGWAAVALATAVPAFAAFGQVGAFSEGPLLAPLERVRWMSFLLGRYVALAFTSWGSATSAQPVPPDTWLDPWVVLGAIAFAGATLRALHGFARGSIEAAFWAFAAAGWLPISQLFPFKFPFADRYLYFVLPGLLGALLLALRPPGAAVRRALPARRVRVALASALAALLLAGSAWRARERTTPWTSGAALLADAAARYPDGTQANLLAAARAARSGDRSGAIEALARARATGFEDPILLVQDPDFLVLRGDPRFRALARDMAARQIGKLRTIESPSRLELQRLGTLHIVREEWPEAEAAFARALAARGPGDERVIRQQLALARSEQRRAQP